MRALVTLAWTTQRPRVTRLAVLAIVCLLTMAFSTQEAVAATSAAGQPWSWSELVTPANVLAVLTLVFHFGFLVSELRAMQKRLDGIAAEFARKDVTDERFRSVEHRIDTVESR